MTLTLAGRVESDSRIRSSPQSPEQSEPIAVGATPDKTNNVSQVKSELKADREVYTTPTLESGVDNPCALPSSPSREALGESI